MASSLTLIQQQLKHLGESGRAVKRLVETGVLDLQDLSGTVQGAKLVRFYGPQATMAIQGGLPVSRPAGGGR